MLFRMNIVIISLVLISILFYFAAGTLSIKMLNLVSITYYEYLFMVFLGAALCYLGFGREHYIIAGLSEKLLERVYIAVAASGITLPTIIIILNVVLGVKSPPSRVKRYYSLRAELDFDSDKLYKALCASVMVGLLCTLYTFFVMRSVPLLNILRFGSSNSANLRWSARNEFGGNAYIRNLGMLTLVPLNSMATYIAYRLIGGNKWRRLAISSAVLSFVVLTWNLEKAPIVFHLVYLFIIKCMTEDNLDEARVFPYVLIGLTLLLLGYYLTSGALPTLSLTSGPVGRTLMTTNGALALHYQYFPSYQPFLRGASFPTIIARILGLSSGWRRSGAVVMSLFNPRGVEANTAGVMNAYFIGEAYANWGTMGSIIATAFVSIFVGVANSIILRTDKTFFTMLCTLVLVKFQVTSLMGGFIDYIYSISLIFSLLFAYSIYSMTKNT